jgi:hypothetical protein
MPRWARRLVFVTPLRAGLLLHRADRGGSEDVRRHLDGAVTALLHGYRAALDDDDAERLCARLAELPDLVRGFAYEGVGAAFTVLDRFLPRRRVRFETVLRGPGAPFAPLLHVGAGLALARVSRRIEDETSGLDAEMRWLPLDAYGFERGVFAAESVMGRDDVPRLSAYGRRAFDQGLGRGLWFRTAADLQRIARTIAGLGRERQADVWSGVGLAIAYAGPNTDASLAMLAEAAGPHLPTVRLGIGLAAFMRSDGRNPSPNTERASRVLCGLPAERAAEEARKVVQALRAAEGGPGAVENPYEAFRAGLQAVLSAASAPTAEAPRQHVSHGV